MEDEQAVGALTEAADAATAPEAPAAVPEQTAAPDWRTVIDTTDAAELRRHPRVAGILGSEIERERRNITERIAAEQQTKAQAEAQAELERLAQEDPDEFSRRYLAQNEQAKIQAQLDGVHQKVRQENIESIGAAFNQVPGWGEIATDRSAQEKLATALAGKADNEVIPAFIATAFDLAVERRAEVKGKEKYDAQIAREREAMRAEIIAEMNRTGVAPGIARGNGAPSASKLDTLPAGDDFNKEWERVYGRR